MLLAESKVEGLLHNQEELHILKYVLLVLLTNGLVSLCVMSCWSFWDSMWHVVWYKHLDVGVIILVLNNNTNIMPVRLA